MSRQVEDALEAPEQLVAMREPVSAEDHSNQLASQHELAITGLENEGVQEVVVKLEQVLRG